MHPITSEYLTICQRKANDFQRRCNEFLTTFNEPPTKVNDFNGF